MRPKLSILVLSAATLPASCLHAQAGRPLLATPSVRITAPVEGSSLVALKGNTHPMALARYDQGAASPTLATGRISMLLRRSPAQQAALDQYMGSLQDPHSPNYRKWLTPAQFGASFGISDQDLQTVEAWLQGQGFEIDAVPAARNFIQFSGTTGQLAQAFHTSIHSYLVNGVSHYSNAADPQIPAALAPVVAGLSPLNDFHSRPMHILGGHAEVTSKDGQVRPAPDSVRGVTPLLTGTIQNRPFLYVTPADAATIYNAPNALNRNFSGGTQQTGANVNIGIIGASDLPVADYLNYRKLFLGDASPAQPTLVIDGTDPGIVNDGSSTEALLDAEVSAALAPGAKLYFYSSSSDLLQDGVYNAALRAVDDNNVALLNVSFGNCEANLGASGNQQFSELWRQAAAQGIAVVVSSGDSGSAGCDFSGTAATQGLNVSGLASTPYDVAVGGTDFNALSLGNNFAQYVGAQNAQYGTALGYIPENPWNDSITNNPPGAFLTNKPAMFTDGSGNAPFTILAAGGGGPSSLGFCNGTVDQNTGNCSVPLAGYPRPPFQANISSADTSIPAGVRLIPDVSLLASPGFQHQASWAVCLDSAVNQDTTATYTDCQTDPTTGQFGVDAVGGTSASTPAFAGVLATVIGSLNGAPRLGLANNVIYNLAATKPSIFHDITAGNISVPCEAGSTNCGTTNFVSGWNAATGYDLATGLGSVDISALAAGWDAVTFTPTTTQLLINGSTSPITFQHGTAISLTANVTPGDVSGSASVTATLTGQAGAAVKELIPLRSGSGTLSPVNDLPGGSYMVQGYYPGDATHAPSISAPAIPITISPEASAPFLSLAIQDIATGQAQGSPFSSPVPYGEYGFAYIQPANANSFNTGVGSHGIATGSVTLLNGGTAVGTQTLSSQGIASFPLYNLAPGTYSFSATYAGDASYNKSSTTTPVPLTISKGPTTLKAVAASTLLPASDSTAVTVELDTDSTGAYPTGAITLRGNGTQFAGTTQNAVLPSGAIYQTATFTVPGTALASGTNTLTASYSGDGNYTGASATTAVTISGGTGTSPGFSLAGPSSGINIATSGQSGTGTVTLTPTNSFSGTVNLSCKVQFTGTGASPTCAIPATLAVTANQAATVTLTVNTTAQRAALVKPTGVFSRPAGPFHWLAAGGSVAFCSVLLWGIPARRRSWRALRTVCAMLFTFTVLGAIGCGGSSNSNSNTGTAAGSYTVIVTGTSGSITSNTQVTVNVQ